MDNRNSSIALGRKFSDDPDVMIKMAKAEIRGAQENGVAATVKHFPGSDGIEYRDSHIAENIMRLTYDEWIKKQGRVFKEIIADGVYSVMIGHVEWPYVDSSMKNGRYLPATVSKKVITDVLYHGAEKSMGVSFGSQYMYYDFYHHFDTFVNAYNISEEAQKAFVKLLYGEIKPNTNATFELEPAHLRLEPSKLEKIA